MGKINIKGGTPCGWVSLCSTCRWAHIVTGFRESELLIVCTEVHPNIRMGFKVKECSSYLDRNRPDYDTMAKLAIHVQPTGTLKPVGFRAKVELVDGEEMETAQS